MHFLTYLHGAEKRTYVKTCRLPHGNLLGQEWGVAILRGVLKWPKRRPIKRVHEHIAR